MGNPEKFFVAISNLLYNPEKFFVAISLTAGKNSDYVTGIFAKFYNEQKSMLFRIGAGKNSYTSPSTLLETKKHAFCML